MNLPFSLIEPFFHFLSILILIYLCFLSLVKYIRKSEYSLFVFRVTVFSVIFYGIDLILNAIKEEPNYLALGSFFKSKLKPDAKKARKDLIIWTRVSEINFLSSKNGK